MAVATALFAGYSTYNVQQNTKLTDIAWANVEALADSNDKLDCNYTREESKCTINVGAKGKIKILNGSVLTADAQGEISFDGKVACISGGNSTCRPIECIDLYTIILDNSND